MSFNRKKVTDHAEQFWWRPCQDGFVWIKGRRIYISIEVSQRKLHGYGGAFLWYSTRRLEGLFLLPLSKIPIAKDGHLAKFPEAVMLASYSDNAGEETALLKALSLKPPYHGLNDCTHFTSECLTKGGFEVANEHAQRGAGSIYEYMLTHPQVKVLGSEVTKVDADKVISSELLKPGDVIVYTTASPRERHHGVVYMGDGTIAMHTFHQFKVPWEGAGGDVNQLYSLFHISIDDEHSRPSATRWVGWWQVADGPKVRYMYLGANGHMHTTNTKPHATTAKPNGPDYWFADDTTLRTCMRMKAIVEEYTMTPPSGPKAPVGATGTRLNDGVPLTAAKL